MFIKNPCYECTAVLPEQYPTKGIPEIVLVGRSNVGKSSIINALARRKKLARIGQAPGKTRKIHFFNMDDIFYIVDLPGYGYAKASKKEQKVWAKLTDEYLNKRKQIKLILMVVDIRHKPSRDDILMYEWIAVKGIPNIIIANKLDKIKYSQRKIHLKIIKETLNLEDERSVIPISANKKIGIDVLWEKIEKII